jgi:hypothetical protein
MGQCRRSYGVVALTIDYVPAQKVATFALVLVFVTAGVPVILLAVPLTPML